MVESAGVRELWTAFRRLPAWKQAVFATAFAGLLAGVATGVIDVDAATGIVEKWMWRMG
jgi:hypothetical protein